MERDVLYPDVGIVPNVGSSQPYSRFETKPDLALQARGGASRRIEGEAATTPLLPETRRLGVVEGGGDVRSAQELVCVDCGRVAEDGERGRTARFTYDDEVVVYCETCDSARVPK